MFVLDLPHSATNVAFLHQPAALVEYERWRPSDPNSILKAMGFQIGGAMWAEVAEAKERLREYASMPENWDGYGALRISEETTKNSIAAVEGILRQAPVPDISPNPNGTISLEWESTWGVAHLEIGRTKFSFYVKSGSGNPYFADGLADQIPADIGQLISRMLFPPQNMANTMTSVRVFYHVRHPY